MKVLVINVGSTSVKYNLFDMSTEAQLATGKVERVGTDEARHVYLGSEGRDEEAAVDGRDPRTALAAVLAHLTRDEGPLEDPRDLDAVGHRVVHGGERLVKPVRIDEDKKKIIRECAVYAPLHNPANLAGIEAAQEVLGEVPHVAVFDTAFHGEVPPAAHMYGIPYEQYLDHGVRRYGFHGPSHQYLALCAAEHLKTDISRLKLVTCHLGGGASVCAIEGGISVETSMGMTPLEGLVMSTRSGDVDPALAVLLSRQGMSADEIDEMLNRQSGLLGLSGVSGDFRDVERAAQSGNQRAGLAIEVFIHRLRKYIGAYSAVLGGANAIVFSGGIGENSARVRAAACEGLVYMGVTLDAARNEDCHPNGGAVDIAAEHAPTRVLVVATDEERMIARETMRCLGGPTAAVRSAHARPIPVGVSVRHVHLTREHCEVLFGEGSELTKRSDISQPGQFVTRETVDLIGPKGELKRVAIINPLRSKTQVEVSRTDAYALGVHPPLRESGKLDGTPGIKLRGLAGELELESGVVMALRHVHMHPDDARAFGVEDRQMIQVRIEGDREMTMGDVLVRVKDSYVLDLHIDTDEANAAGLTNQSVVAFEGIQG